MAQTNWAVRFSYDEHHDILGADVDGRIHDAGGGIVQVIDDLAETHVDEGVDHQQAHHAQDRNTHAAAAQFHQRQDGNDGHGDHVYQSLVTMVAIWMMDFAFAAK